MRKGKQEYAIMIKFIKNIGRTFLNPFDQELSFFLLIWFFASSADFVFWVSYGNPIFGIYMATHGLLMSYVITFFVGLLYGKLKLLLRYLIILIGVVNVLVDTAIHCIMKCGFTKDLVAVFMGTNANETKEFLGMYINPKMILIIIAIYIVAILIYKMSKLCNLKTRLKYLCLIIVIASASVIYLRDSKNWDGVFLMKLKTMLEYKPTPDLRNYRKNHDVIFGESPKNVVFIIGESLNKDHMSLYGYEKKTTPYLDSLKNVTNLITYNNVRSSAIGTVPAFRYMMSSLRESDSVEEWVKKDFLLDIIKSAGYNTMWISNQSSSGVHDNIVARFAELSDSIYWCGTKYMGPSKVDLDEVVLPPAKHRALDILNKPNFTIIHLAGNHENFRSRYSDKYSIFKEVDYIDCLENQRRTLSEYDNSVVYNDWIVSEIIKMYEDKESIVIYLSDHSLDIYDSSEDYAGHARPTDVKSVEAGQNIPFIVYFSPLYESNFSNIVGRIRASTERQYYTDDVMYSILDLMNISRVDSIDVAKYSIFNIN